MRLGIGRRNPLFVRHLLVLPFFVEAAHLFVRRLVVRCDRSLFTHQARHELLPVLARVAAHDALHGRVGFQERAVDADGLAGQQLLFGGDPEHKLKHLVEHFFRQTAAGVAQGFGVGRRLTQRNPQELPQAETVGAPPGDAALTIDPFEVAHQQHAEVDPWRNRRLPALFLLCVVPLATPLDPMIEVGFGQQRVEPLIKRMTSRLRQTVGHHEQRFLPLSSLTHRHRALPP
jgi:hypothetical protein